jgi:hypothetical protein
MTNTQAYNTPVLITAVESFIAQSSQEKVWG